MEKENTNNTQFDFSRPISFEESDYYDAVEYNQLRSRLKTKHKSQTHQPKFNVRLFLLVIVLLLSLIAVGSFSIVQTMKIQDLEEKLNNGSQVAGINEQIKKEHFIVGSGWTILVDQEPPDGYVLEHNLIEADYLNRKVSATSFLARINKGAMQLTTGIEIHTAEYDNKMTLEEFVSVIEQYLGKNYLKSNQILTVSNQFDLVRFSPKSKDDPTYYVTMTFDNYYVIKVFNQTERFPEFIDYTRFTDKLISGLWLN